MNARVHLSSSGGLCHTGVLLVLSPGCMKLDGKEGVSDDDEGQGRRKSWRVGDVTGTAFA
jgi:hypothetical protein